jgi:hypothetical protein
MAAVECESWHPFHSSALGAAVRGPVPGWCVRGCGVAGAEAGAERFDVFFSYAYRDGEWPVALAGNLERLGLRVWFDRWELAAGQRVATRLQDGLAKADVLVAVVSPRWIASEWCNEEFAYAMTASAGGRQRVIPVLWGDVATVPPFIASRLFVDFRAVATPDQYEVKVQQLVRAVRGWSIARTGPSTRSYGWGRSPWRSPSRVPRWPAHRSTRDLTVSWTSGSGHCGGPGNGCAAVT